VIKTMIKHRVQNTMQISWVQLGSPVCVHITSKIYIFIAVMNKKGFFIDYCY